jgi:chromosomal replication initiator protein
MQSNSIWHDIKSQLAEELEPSTFEEMFASIEGVYEIKNNYLYIMVDNDFVKKRIEMLFLKKLNRMLEHHVSEKHEFRFITQEEAAERMKLKESDTAVQEDYKTNLNPTYTFNNFVVGLSNRLSYMSATKVADQPGVVANPLFIFGDVGLGKTHLMQAVGNYVLENDINTKVRYIKADQFVEDYVRHAHKKKYAEFFEAYENIDVLLVDDIQFLAKKEKSQEEFFKLFEHLYQQQKQMVITSDRKASDLKDIMNHLTNRFAWGVTVDINRPDLEHRIKILEKKLNAETNDTSIMPKKVIEYIASVFDNNVRELEGALKRVLFYCTAFNYEFTVKNAELALENLVKPKANSRDFMKQRVQNCLSATAAYYKISVSDLISKKRTRNYLYPRQVAMYLVKHLYDLPYKRIGLYFSNRDHSTVMHSVEKITSEIPLDSNVRIDVEKLLIKCGEKE